jgi:two-component system OmpR family response regulator
MRILLVEDDRRLARQIEAALGRAGYVVDASTDGEEGRFLGDTEPYDAVVLDLGLPRIDGLAVLAEWRRTGRTMPVLILTARGSWREKVTGLRAGADDYLAKPFEMEELIARLEALIRRGAGRAGPALECGPVALDPATGRVTFAGQTVELTALEYRTLSYLLHHAGSIVSKTELTEHIYAQDFDRDSNVIEVLINRLRKKLDPALIRTRRGQGYQLVAPAAAGAAEGAEGEADGA